MAWRIAVYIWMVFVAAPAVAGSPDLPALCELAAIRSAQARAMPPDVLRALTLTETGRKLDGGFRPWPWTVNIAGKGYWFETKAEAIAFVQQAHANGARSFDVGCFQLNYRWHGAGFASFDEMFDPDANATYAASFMADLYAEGGHWGWAAGAYHSRTPSLGSKYRARFERILAKLKPVALPPVIVATAPILPSISPAQTVASASDNGSAFGDGSGLFTTSKGRMY